MQLRQLAYVRTGLVLSRKKAEGPNANIVTYKLLTLKSFENYGLINTSALDSFNTNQHISCQYITQEHDVIVRLSEPNTAVYIDNTLKGILIPSLFAIIRLSSKQLNPQFLAWLINSNYVKKKIHKSRVGSAIQVINTSFLGQLEIKILPKEKQLQIVEINSLYLREKQLLNQLIIEKEVLYNLAMHQVYGEEI